MTKALTVEGTIVGTFQYMAPEQLEGEEADGRTDVFAFGLVLYEMVTGRKAFQGKSQATLISAIVSSDPPSTTAVQPAYATLARGLRLPPYERDRAGYTPLMLAVLQSRTDMVRLLLEMGANPSLRDPSNVSVLDMDAGARLRVDLLRRYNAQ